VEGPRQFKSGYFAETGFIDKVNISLPPPAAKGSVGGGVGAAGSAAALAVAME
jgi:hypothetical protein